MSDDKTQVRGPAVAWQLRPLDGAEVIEIADGFTVGRSEECDLVLSEGFVSRKHAVFSVQGMKLLLRDNGSSNGTFINDEKIEEKALKPGDRVSFDTNEFEVVLDTGAHAEDSGATVVRPATPRAEDAPAEPESEPESGPEADRKPDEPSAQSAAGSAKAPAAEEGPSPEDPSPEDPSPEDQGRVVYDRTASKRPSQAAEQQDAAGASTDEDPNKTVVVGREDAGAQEGADDTDKTAVWKPADVAEGGTVIVGGTERTSDLPKRSSQRDIILTGLTEPAVGKEYVLSKRKMTVGRSPLNHIILRAPSVSSQHAEIENERGAWVVYDLDSSNGTFVNGEQISDCVLEPGDILTFGDVELEFDAAGKQAGSAPARGDTGGGGLAKWLKVFAIAAIVVAVVLGGLLYMQSRGIEMPSLPAAQKPTTTAAPPTAWHLEEHWRVNHRQGDSLLVGPRVADLDGNGVAEVVMLDTAGRLLFADSRSGSQAATVKLSGRYLAPPVLVPGESGTRVLTVSDGGTVNLHNHRGQALWSTELGGAAKGVYQSPLVVQVPGANLVVVPTEGLGPVGIDLDTGRKLWDGAGGAKPVTNLLMHKGDAGTTLYAGTGDGKVIAWTLSPFGIASLWQTPIPEGFQPINLVLGRDTVVAASAAGEVVAINRLNGEIRWGTGLHSAVLGRGAVVGTKLMVPLQGGAVATLQLEDGRELDRTQIGGQLEAGITVSASHAFVVSSNGSVAMLDSGGRLLDRQFVSGADAFVEAPAVYDADGDGVDDLFLISLNGVLSRFSITQ